MIFNLFAKAGRFMCSVRADEALTAEKEGLAALIGAMLLLTFLAFCVALSFVQSRRMDPIEMLVFVLATGGPWMLFDFCIKPSSQWLKDTESHQ